MRQTKQVKGSTNVKHYSNVIPLLFNQNLFQLLQYFEIFLGIK